MDEEDWSTILHKRRRLETTWSWSDAPSEILSTISSKLFFNDRHNFKLVCKSWNSISPNKPLLPPPLDSPYFDSPCLMFSQRSTNSWKLFHSVFDDYYYLDLPELKDAEIHCSKFGWLLMSRNECPLFFFNPFTKEKLQLPPTNDSFYSVCFTSPPTSRDCTVFGIFSMSSISIIDLGHIKVGDREWELETLEINDGHAFWHYSNYPPLFHNGKFYCLDYYSRNFRIFDPTKHDEHRWIRSGESYKPKESGEDEDDQGLNYESYITEVEGEIWGVFVRNYDGKVNVVKWDFIDSCWKKLECLGDKCLYVSASGSFAEKCNISGMANKIYFSKFRDKSGVMYSLRSGMYHSVEGDYASREAYGLSHMDYAAWIKPSLDKE